MAIGNNTVQNLSKLCKSYSVVKGLDYWWVETARLETPYRIATLSWNNDGNRLITAGEQIQLWGNDDSSYSSSAAAAGASFHIGNSAPEKESVENLGWHCMWRTRPANPVAHLAFSPDGTLFATAAKNDRLVRIWYQNQQRKSFYGKEYFVHSFISIMYFSSLVSKRTNEGGPSLVYSQL